MFVAVLVLCTWSGPDDFFMCDHLHSFEAHETIAECAKDRRSLYSFYKTEFDKEGMTYVLRSFCVEKPE